MRKKAALGIILLCGAAMLAQGCSDMEEFRNYIQEETHTYEPEMPKLEETSTEPLTQGQQEEEEGQHSGEVSALYYAYHCLDEEKQKLYREMLDAMTGMESDVRLSTVDKSVLEQVFSCVMNDHPELFYVEGYQYTEYTFGSTTTSITFSGTYSMTKEQVQQTGALIDQKIEECFRQMPEEEDEYGTVKYLYEWLINQTEYDKNVENNQNICSVFLQGRSVCQGYAKAMQYMLQRAQIQCLVVTGFTNGERHGWNLVRVNGAYYYLDPTWGDASYASGTADGAAEGFFPSINYDYFLVTTDELTRTHSFEMVVELPQCTEIKDNYFVREGLYFESYDEDRLALIFGSEAAHAAWYVTLKCSSSECYARMVQNLIEEQKIFQYITRQGSSIAYTSNEKQRTISFWNIY